MKCRGCGAQRPPDELSERMECGRCFVARMGSEPTTVQIPRQTLAECAADWRKQLSEQGLVRKETP